MIEFVWGFALGGAVGICLGVVAVCFLTNQDSID